MRSSEALLRSVLACAAGAKVKLVLGRNEYELPLKPPAVVPAPPDPIEVLAKQIAERDAAERADRAAAEARAKNEAEELRKLVAQTIEGQERIVETLMLPVIPTGYDKSGRIMSAQRKKD